MSLRQVLADGAVRSVFQPIVQLDDGTVVAYEALARGPAGPWERPDVLFAAAREEGLLAELDDACRRAALRGAVATGLSTPLALFVNVEPEVLETAPVEQLLAIAESAPGGLRVVLEITERALAHRPAELLQTVERIRSFGWGVALDDVGADPLSLAFMPLLRPDIVKLDLRLVQDQVGPDVAEIMSAVNAYAEGSAALILAEGIETEEHLRLARGLGATLGQGWLFGRPAAEATSLYPIGELVLPFAACSTRGDRSPFSFLPPDARVRHAPKRLLIQLSKHLEREASRLGRPAMVTATFQHARHFTPQTVARYTKLAATVGFVGALGEDLSAEPAPSVRGATLSEGDPVLGEWDVTVVAPHYAAALLARDLGDGGPDLDRNFEFALTFERQTVVAATHAILARIAARPGYVDDRPATALIGSKLATHSREIVSAQNQTETSLERALAATPTGVVIADATRPDLPLIYVNQAFERLSGLRAEEILGHNCRILQGPGTDPAAVARIRTALATGAECRERLLNHRGPDRTPWWNELYLAPVRAADGAVVQFVGIQHDVTAQVDAEHALHEERERGRRYLERIEELAFQDPLTGLPNRRQVEEQTEVLLWEAAAATTSVGLLFLDLNDFKAVNDDRGHAAGDELLRQVAAKLRGRLRRDDLLARLGGDEFLVVLPRLDRLAAAEQALSIAAQLRMALTTAPHDEIGVSASIGAATYPQDGDQFGVLLHCADTRMYAEKALTRAL
jgi:diguanylate cyclase (GGDEF)-like protein/PAS domain S-box-containing protein